MPGVIPRYRNFLCGGSMGFDIMGGECVVQFKKEHPDVKLGCILPFEKQHKNSPLSGVAVTEIFWKTVIL